MRVLEPLAQGAGVPVLDQAQVVDAGRGLRWWGVGVGLGVDVLADPERQGLPDTSAVVVDVDVGEVERVEDQLLVVGSSAGYERPERTGPLRRT